MWVHDRTLTAVFSPPEPADTGASAALALAAFNGAVIGCVGSVAALIVSDAWLATAAAFGAAVCGGIWHRQLVE